MKSINFIISILVCSCVITSAFGQKKQRTHKAARVTSKPADMLSLLQGTWSSVDDKKTFFQIEGDRQIDIYGNDILDTATVNFYDECPSRITPEDPKSKSGKYLIVAIKPDDFYCYSVDRISPQQLVLTYLPKGSILRYKKVPAIKLEANDTDKD